MRNILLKTLGMEAHSAIATTLRCALDAGSDLKVQRDNQTERGGPNYPPRYGDSRLLSVAHDRMF